MNTGESARILSRVTPLSRLRGGVYVRREGLGDHDVDQSAETDDGASSAPRRGTDHVGAPCH